MTVHASEPPPKPVPHRSRKPLRKVPRPSSIGPSKWYSGTVKYPNGDRDDWRYYAPTLRSGTRLPYAGS